MTGNPRALTHAFQESQQVLARLIPEVVRIRRWIWRHGCALLAGSVQLGKVVDVKMKKVK